MQDTLSRKRHGNKERRQDQETDEKIRKGTDFDQKVLRYAKPSDFPKVAYAKTDQSFTTRFINSSP